MVLDMKLAGKPKKGLFSKKSPLPPPGPDMNLLHDIATLTRRLRVLEGQYTNSRRRITVIGENMLSHGKKLNEEVDSVNEELTELKKAVEDMNEKMILIIKELRNSARKGDVEVLKKYINIWQPLNFVTRDQVDKIVKDAITTFK